MFLMRGVITRWSRSAWRASIWRGLGAGFRLAVGSPGPVLCDVSTAHPPSRNIKLIATTSGILQVCRDVDPVNPSLFCTPGIVAVSFRIMNTRSVNISNTSFSRWEQTEKVIVIDGKLKADVSHDAWGKGLPVPCTQAGVS